MARLHKLLNISRHPDNKNEHKISNRRYLAFIRRYCIRRRAAQRISSKGCEALVGDSVEKWFEDVKHILMDVGFMDEDGNIYVACLPRIFNMDEFGTEREFGKVC